MIYDPHKDLPEQRAILYKQAEEVLMRRWDATRIIHRHTELPLETMRQLLTVVAWQLQLDGHYDCPEDRLTNIIDVFIQEKQPEVRNDLVKKDLVVQNGVLTVLDGIYSFSHPALQEYFAALYAIEQKQLSTLLENYANPRWEEVFLHYAAYAPDVDHLLEHLFKQDSSSSEDEALFHSSLILAGRCLASYIGSEPLAYEQNIRSSLVTTLTETPYSLTRNKIADTLVEIGGTQVSRQLLKYLSLENKNDKVRKAIAKSIGERGAGTITASIKLRSDQLHERADEVQDLAIVNAPSIVLGLAQLLSDAQLDDKPPESLSDELGALNEQDIISRLISYLANKSTASSVHVSIIQTLVAIGDASTADDLLTLLENQDFPSDVCEALAQAIGQLGKPDIAPRLMKLLLMKKHSEVSCSIVHALGNLRNSAVTPELVPLLRDKQFDSRYAPILPLSSVHWERKTQA